jgi:hypothetical protein
MQINKMIENVLLELGKSIKVHTIDKENMILEIDYDKYVEDLVKVFNQYSQEQK